MRIEPVVNGPEWRMIRVANRFHLCPSIALTVETAMLRCHARAVPRADAAETRFRILHPNPMTRQQGAGVPSWFAQRERTWRSRLIPSLIRAALAAAIWFFFFY